MELRYSNSMVNNTCYLVISVFDNGGGFPDEILNKIYKEAILRSEGTGKGQGTMYVAYFAELMNCKLAISNEESKYGYGACVSIKIPMKEG